MVVRLPRVPVRTRTRESEEVAKHLHHLSNALPFDVNDAVTVVTPSPGKEFGVPVPRSMRGIKPRWYLVVYQNGPGHVWASRGSLSDGETIWLRSTAPAGVTFVIVPFAGTSAAAKPEPPGPDEDAQPEEDGQDNPTTTTNTKKKSKKWKKNK